MWDAWMRDAWMRDVGCEMWDADSGEQRSDEEVRMEDEWASGRRVSFGFAILIGVVFE